jgi:hypothetical protein
MGNSGGPDRNRTCATRFRNTLQCVRHRLSSSAAALLSSAGSTSPSVLVRGRPWALSSKLSSHGVHRLSEYRAPRTIGLETRSALFTGIRQLSLGVAGAKLSMPACPTCVVRCRVSSSVLGQDWGKTGADQESGVSHFPWTYNGVQVTATSNALSQQLTSL